MPVPSGFDGDSFARDVREPALTRDTTAYSEFALRSPNARYMVRHGAFKYSFYVNDMPELYDLRNDPAEMRNLALLAEHKGRVREMHRRLLEWYRPPEAGSAG